MQSYLSIPEVEGVPALCAPSDAERDLARLQAEKQRLATVVAGAAPTKRKVSAIRSLFARLRSKP